MSMVYVNGHWPRWDRSHGSYGVMKALGDSALKGAFKTLNPQVSLEVQKEMTACAVHIGNTTDFNACYTDMEKCSSSWKLK